MSSICSARRSELQRLHDRRPELHRADVLPGQAVGRIDSRTCWKVRIASCRAAGLAVGDAERVQRFDVVTGQTLEQLDGAAGLPI